MRVFKHIDKKKQRELSSLFPSLFLDELHDNDLVLKYHISIWDKWYKDGVDMEIEPTFECSDKEELERYNRLYGVAADIVKSYEVYGIFYGRGRGQIKEVKSQEQLLKDLNHHRFTMRPLLIPSLKAIYNVSWDFTAYIYCMNNNCALPILNFAYARDLKLINRGPYQ